MNFLLESLKNLNPIHNFKLLNKNIRNDILAGITVAIIALPLALAFGEVSGLGPEAGIIGAIFGGFLGGLFGGCNVSVSGPTAPTATQIAALMVIFSNQDGQPDLVAIFTIIFLSGLLMVIFSLMKIAKYIHYIPYSVVAGFMCGIGLIIIFDQTKYLFDNQSFNEIGIIFLPSLIIMLFWDSFKKNIRFFKNIPAPVFALLFGTIIVFLMDLETISIGDKMLNNKNSIFNFYIPDFDRLSSFLSPAFAIAGLVIIDSLLTCLISDNMIGIRHISSREVFGQGLANMLSGFFGGTTTATATMFTVSNIKFGAKTPLSSIIYAITLLGILLGLKSLVSIIPISCIAAILFKVGIDIMDYRVLPILRRLPIIDLTVFVIVILITVFYNLMTAVLIGVIFSTLGSIKFINSRQEHKINSFDKEYGIKNQKANSTIVLKPRGALFFGSIEPLIKLYHSTEKHKILIINMNEITNIDLSGLYAIEDIISRAKIYNRKVFIYGINQNIKRDLKKLNFIQNLGKENYFESEEDIISKIK